MHSENVLGEDISRVLITEEEIDLAVSKIALEIIFVIITCSSTGICDISTPRYENAVNNEPFFNSKISSSIKQSYCNKSEKPSDVLL